MPCGTEEFFNFSRWLGAFNRSSNKNVDCNKVDKIIIV